MNKPGPFHDLILGDPFGQVYPPRPEPKPPTTEPRAVALEVLRGYLSELLFARPGGRRVDGSREPPIEFKIPIENIHVEMPDNVDELQHPSIAFEEGADGGSYETIGLTGQLDESSYNKYGEGTALTVMSEYNEVFKLWVFADEKPLRRAMMARIVTKLSPTEQMYGIRFRLPDYFDEPCCFSVSKSARPDDAESANRRRRGLISVEMRFNIVALVNVEPLRSIVASPVVTMGDADLVLDTRVEGSGFEE